MYVLLLYLQKNYQGVLVALNLCMLFSFSIWHASLARSAMPVVQLVRVLHWSSIPTRGPVVAFFATAPGILVRSKGGFPVLARSSSQLAASACMSTFIQSQC